MYYIENELDLLPVKLGDLFVWHGYEYKAQGDAREYNGSVRIKACRRELGSKSGYMLADIMESLPQDSNDPVRIVLSSNMGGQL